METAIERIGGKNKLVVKHNNQSFILQCNKEDIKYTKECFDAMIDNFYEEMKNTGDSLPNLRNAFEAGMIYQNNNIRGTTSLWTDIVANGFNKYIRECITINK